MSDTPVSGATTGAGDFEAGGDDGRAARSEAEMDRILGPIVEDFRRFYDEHVVATPEDPPVYCFFTRGLAHWAVKMQEFYPAHRSLVLIGGDLTAEETAWLRRRGGRPLFNIERPADDKVAWELLFAVNRTDFGWIDVDCLLLDEALLDEMADLPDDAALNTLWSFTAVREGVVAPYPHFVFVNHAVLHGEAMAELGLGPATYRYEPGDDHLGRQVRWGAHRVLDDAQAAAIDRVLGAPWREREEPYFNERPFFEPLQAYALAAQDRGFRVNEVRRLGDRRDEDHWSEQIIHASSIAYVTNPAFPWDRFPKAPRERYILILVADQLLLLDYADDAPDDYRRIAAERWEWIERVIQRKTSHEKMSKAARALMAHVVAEDQIAGDDRWRFVRQPAEAVPA